MNTYLIQAATRTRNLDCPASYRDHMLLFLVDAECLEHARRKGMKIHCPEAFDEEEWQLGDNWVIVRGESERLHVAFHLGAEHTCVDSNCDFWLESITEVEEADALILKKYVPLQDVEIPNYPPADDMLIPESLAE